MRTLTAVVSLLAAGCGGGGSAAGPARPIAAASRPAAAPVEVAPAAINGPRGQLALETADGAPVMLAEHGKPVTVIALWATYCTPCLDELPYVEALHRRNRDADVAVLAVNIDDADGQPRAREIERELGLTLPRLYAGGRLMEALAPRDEAGEPRMLLPLLVVIDPTFQIHHRLGFEAGVALDRYLAEKRALIAAARRGEPPAPAALPGTGVASNRFKLRLPKMSEAELAAFVPRFKAQMAQVFPRLDPEALEELGRRAEAAARTGGELEVDLADVMPTLSAPR